MTAPFITPAQAQPVTLKLWSYLPTFVQQTDAANGYQFLAWLDGIGQQLQPITNLIRDNGVVPGWSVIMDVGRCPTYALPWLAQFVGVRFVKGVQTTSLAMRQQIVALAGFARGTVTAIKAALRGVVGTAATIKVVERYPDPYSFLVIIAGSITGLSYAELGAEYGRYTQVSAAFPFYDDFPSILTTKIADTLASVTPGGTLSSYILTEG